MSLTSNETLMLATPIVAAVMAGLLSWSNYAAVMRRRKARKAAETTSKENAGAFVLEENRPDGDLSLVELTPTETATLRAMMRGKKAIHLRQAEAEPITP